MTGHCKISSLSSVIGSSELYRTYFSGILHLPLAMLTIDVSQHRGLKYGIIRR